MDVEFDVLRTSVLHPVNDVQPTSKYVGIPTEFDVHKTELDVEMTNFDVQRTELDAQATKLDVRATKLDAHATKLDGQPTELDVQRTKPGSNLGLATEFSVYPTSF